MMYIILLIYFVNIVSGDDSSEAKYIDLLPEKEKEDFLETVARRIYDNIKHKNAIPERDEHTKLIEKVLKEESLNLKRVSQNTSDDSDGKGNAVEEGDALDLTQEGKRNKRNSLKDNKNSDIVHVQRASKESNIANFNELSKELGVSDTEDIEVKHTNNKQAEVINEEITTESNVEGIGTEITLGDLISKENSSVRDDESNYEPEVKTTKSPTTTSKPAEIRDTNEEAPKNIETAKTTELSYSSTEKLIVTSRRNGNFELINDSSEKDSKQASIKTNNESLTEKINSTNSVTESENKDIKSSETIASGTDNSNETIIKVIKNSKDYIKMKHRIKKTALNEYNGTTLESNIMAQNSDVIDRRDTDIITTTTMGTLIKNNKEINNENSLEKTQYKRNGIGDMLAEATMKSNKMANGPEIVKTNSEEILIDGHQEIKMKNNTAVVPKINHNKTEASFNEVITENINITIKHNNSAEKIKSNSAEIEPYKHINEKNTIDNNESTTSETYTETTTVKIETDGIHAEASIKSNKMRNGQEIVKTTSKEILIDQHQGIEMKNIKAAVPKINQNKTEASYNEVITESINITIEHDNSAENNKNNSTEIKHKTIEKNTIDNNESTTSETNIETTTVKIKTNGIHAEASMKSNKIRNGQEIVKTTSKEILINLHQEIEMKNNTTAVPKMNHNKTEASYKEVINESNDITITHDNSAEKTISNSAEIKPDNKTIEINTVENNEDTTSETTTVKIETLTVATDINKSEAKDFIVKEDAKPYMNQDKKSITQIPNTNHETVKVFDNDDDKIVKTAEKMDKSSANFVNDILKPLHDDNPKPKEYEVYKAPNNEPSDQDHEAKDDNVIEENPYYVPVYNYGPEHAYYNPKNRLGPNADDDDVTIIKNDGNNVESIAHDYDSIATDEGYHENYYTNNYQNRQDSNDNDARNDVDYDEAYNKEKEFIDRMGDTTETRFTNNQKLRSKDTENTRNIKKVEYMKNLVKIYKNHNGKHRNRQRSFSRYKLNLPIVVNYPKYSDIIMNTNDYLDIDYRYPTWKKPKHYKSRKHRLMRTNGNKFPKDIIITSFEDDYNDDKSLGIKNQIRKIREMMYSSANFGFMKSKEVEENKYHGVKDFIKEAPKMCDGEDPSCIEPFMLINQNHILNTKQTDSGRHAMNKSIASDYFIARANNTSNSVVDYIPKLSARTKDFTFDGSMKSIERQEIHITWITDFSQIHDQSVKSDCSFCSFNVCHNCMCGGFFKFCIVPDTMPSDNDNKNPIDEDFPTTTVGHFWNTVKNISMLPSYLDPIAKHNQLSNKQKYKKKPIFRSRNDKLPPKTSLRDEDESVEDNSAEIHVSKPNIIKFNSPDQSQDVDNPYPPEEIETSDTKYKKVPEITPKNKYNKINTIKSIMEIIPDDVELMLKVSAMLDNENNEEKESGIEEKELQCLRSVDSIDLEPYVTVLQDMVHNEAKGLVQYDWMGTSIDIQAAVFKLKEMTESVKNNEVLDNLDFKLLKYFTFLHKFSTKRHNDIRMFLPKPKYKYNRTRSQRGVYSRTWLKRRLKKFAFEVSGTDLYYFVEFLEELQYYLYDLHTALTQIALVTSYKNQKWFKNLSELYLDKSRKNILELLLHVTTVRLLDLVENSAQSGLQDGFLKYVINNEKETEKSKNELVLILKIIEELKKIQ